jgi:hypothetical protein
MNRTARLSALEQSILNRLAVYSGRSAVPDLLYPASPRTPSQTASFSRCLRRLQRRGLVTLHVFRPAKENEKVGMVAPTREGLAAARREPPQAAAP